MSIENKNKLTEKQLAVLERLYLTFSACQKTKTKTFFLSN